MKSFRLIFLCICFYHSLIAQSPELVRDFNPGQESSFNEFNFMGIEHNDRLIFPLISSELGEELGVLENGEMSLLKDLNEGEGDASPSNFIEFNGLIYFSAIDDLEGGSIWTTDGTEENTQILFSFVENSNIKPAGLIVSESGWLYYTYNNTLYRTDGTLNESLLSGVGFLTAFEQQSNNYSHYRDEIAFLVEDNNFVKLYTIESDSVKLLATSEETSSFIDIFGLNEVSSGLIFSIDDSFNDETSGTYVYNESIDSLGKITIDGKEAIRLHNYSNESSLALVSGGGYFATNGTQNEEELLYAGESGSLRQGLGVVNGVFEDKMIFHAAEGGFLGDDFIYYTDGTATGTIELFESSEFLSNFFIHNNYAFLASGTSNGAEPELYYVNMNDGSFNNFFNFNQRSANVNSILILGVQNNKLYFLSNLDQSIGRELYSIDVDLNLTTNIESTPVTPDFSIQYTSTNFKVLSEEFLKLQLKAYSIDGKALKSEIISTNTEYELPICNGICILSLSNDKYTTVHKFINKK